MNPPDPAPPTPAKAVDWKGKVRKLSWQEPLLYFGRGSLSAGTEGVEVTHGEIIFLPLEYSVHQNPSTTRALAKGGKVVEKYENRFGSKELSPLNLQTVVVVTAKI